MSVVALAIVSRENIPLLIKTRSDYASDPEAAAERLKLIYLLHSSLDIIEEKQTQTQNRDAYLGTNVILLMFQLYLNFSYDRRTIEPTGNLQNIWTFV